MASSHSSEDITQEHVETDSSRKLKFRSKRRGKTSRKEQLKAARTRKVCLNAASNDTITERGCITRPTPSSTSSLQEAGNSISDIDSKETETPKVRSRFDLKRKRLLEEEIDPDGDSLNNSEYFLVNKEVLNEALQTSAQCSICKSGNIYLNVLEKHGIARKMILRCDNAQCINQSCFYTSKRSSSKSLAEKESPGPKPFELNLRYVLAMRLLGKGYAGMNSFTGMMNMGNSMSKKCFNKILDSIENVSLKIAEDSMNCAAGEVRGVNTEIVNATAMFDGTWQKRGYSSLVGLVSCISTLNFKVMDFEIMRKTCKKCHILSKMDKNCERYASLENHKCDKDHEGSAPVMEVVGTRAIFNRSVAKRNLRYTGYVGDGDSKTYETIVSEKVYGEEIDIVKKECIGHVQKRMGTALRKLKLTTGKQKLSDGKTLGGNGRLTFKEIDRLQTYYGLAIRRNVGNLLGMKSSIAAILRHRLSTDAMPNHSECPKGPETWCKYNKDPENFKHKNPLPKAVAIHIKPVFDRLSNNKILERCLDGFNQNAAESYNGLL